METHSLSRVDAAWVLVMVLSIQAMRIDTQVRIKNKICRICLMEENVVQVVQCRCSRDSGKDRDVYFDRSEMGLDIKSSNNGVRL